MWTSSKNYIDKEGKGQSPVEANMQFAYWGAMIAMGIAGIISYWRMRKTHKIVVSVSPPSTTTTPITENVSQLEIPRKLVQ